MIDIHSHILPGLDDGPKTLEESVAMVKMAAAAGTTDIVATPHANPQFSFDPEAIEQKLAELQTASGNTLRIYGGCDLHLTVENIQDALAHPAKYAINHKCYLLVEFSDLLIPKATGEIFDRMCAAGITPIVTHPERNYLLHKSLEQIQAWVQNGALVQVTAQSFAGRFGRSARAISDELMRRRLVHFVASDAHDPQDRPPVLSQAYRYIAKKYGERLAERLLVENPRAALTGEPLAPAEPGAGRKRWYHFLRR